MKKVLISFQVSQFLDDDVHTDKKEWTCTPCPPGSNCGRCRAPNETTQHACTAATLAPVDGWWRVPERLSPDPNKRFARCPFPTDCSERVFGKNRSGCAPGTTGNLCATCEDGYDRSSSTCSPCVEGEIGIRIGTLCGVLVALAAVAWGLRRRLAAWRRKYFAASKDARLVLKNLVSFGQVAQSCPGMLAFFEFPDTYTLFLHRTFLGKRRIGQTRHHRVILYT